LGRAGALAELAAVAVFAASQLGARSSLAQPDGR
jgi:hypothetical protein